MQNMEIITATDLARKTREVLDTVARDRETVLVERNHITIARIVPPEPTMTVAQALAMIQPMLTTHQGKRWQKDARGNFDEKLRDPWA